MHINIVRAASSAGFSTVPDNIPADLRDAYVQYQKAQAGRPAKKGGVDESGVPATVPAHLREQFKKLVEDHQRGVKAAKTEDEGLSLDDQNILETLKEGEGVVSQVIGAVVDVQVI